MTIIYHTTKSAHACFNALSNAIKTNHFLHEFDLLKVAELSCHCVQGHEYVLVTFQIRLKTNQFFCEFYLLKVTELLARLLYGEHV